MVPGSFGCGSAVLAAMVTLAPSRAARSAIASPMPRDPPEMNSVLPLSDITFLLNHADPCRLGRRLARLTRRHGHPEYFRTPRAKAARLRYFISRHFLPPPDFRQFSRATRMTTLSVAVFVLVYLGMALGRIPGLAVDRTGVALLGLIVLLASEDLSLEEAGAAVDMPTIALLFALMILSAQFEHSGFYGWIAHKIVHAARNPKRLLAVIIAVTGVLAAIFTNDVVVFALAPLVAAGLMSEKLDPRPYLIGLAGAANAGSAATLIGNPQNILIGQAGGLDFWKYLAFAIPPTIACLAITFLAVVATWRMLPGSGKSPDGAPPPQHRPLPACERHCRHRPADRTVSDPAAPRAFGTRGRRSAADVAPSFFAQHDRRRRLAVAAAFRMPVRHHRCLRQDRPVAGRPCLAGGTRPASGPPFGAGSADARRVQYHWQRAGGHPDDQARPRPLRRRADGACAAVDLRGKSAAHRLALQHHRRRACSGLRRQAGLRRFRPLRDPDDHFQPGRDGRLAVGHRVLCRCRSGARCRRIFAYGRLHVELLFVYWPKHGSAA